MGATRPHSVWPFHGVRPVGVGQLRGHAGHAQPGPTPQEGHGPLVEEVQVGLLLAQEGRAREGGVSTSRR